MNRWRDWWKQAEADLRLARVALDSVTLFSLDRELVEKAISRFVDELSKKKEVLSVVIFGSWAKGTSGVGSDVDFLIILKESKLSFLERIPAYMPSGFPIDADVFPYTIEEVRKGIPLVEQALKEGKVVFERIADGE